MCAYVHAKSHLGLISDSVGYKRSGVQGSVDFSPSLSPSVSFQENAGSYLSSISHLQSAEDFCVFPGVKVV